MRNSNKRDYFTEQEVLDIERNTVLDSAPLQARIVKITQDLPQYTEQNEVAKVYHLSVFLDKMGLKKRSLSMNFKPYAASIAAGLAVIAISSTLLTTPVSEEPSVTDFSQMSSDQLAEEIEWQSIMLLNDELAFSDF